MNKLGIFIQARIGSTRFPKKIYEPFGNSTVLQTLLDTCKKVKVPNSEMIIQVISSKADPVEDAWLSDTKIDDLVSRYYDAANHFDVDRIVRLTSDCPLIPKELIAHAASEPFDYISNVNPRTFPDGYDIQVISRKALEWIFHHQLKNREHPFFDLEYDYNVETQFTQIFTLDRIINSDPYILNPHHPENKLSIDTIHDLQRCQQVWGQICKSPSLS